MPVSIDLRNLFASLYYITGVLVDGGNGVRIGTMGACMNRAFGANVDVTLNHPLGRVPNGYKAIRSSSGGVLYDASDGTASWTASTIKLRATVAGTYSFEVL